MSEFFGAKISVSAKLPFSTHVDKFGTFIMHSGAIFYIYLRVYSICYCRFCGRFGAVALHAFDTVTDHFLFAWVVCDITGQIHL